MIAPLRHRGPDDEGVWIDAEAGIGLGFRRLSIVDLTPHGHQPMTSASGRYTLVFNGEIYNARTLAPELSGHGHRFRGHSDTEVLLAAVEQWDLWGALDRFIGMFAIALWDAELRRLHLIRDRLGIKPLFVHRRPGFISFGSELKALAAAPGFERDVSEEAVHAYLRFSYVPAPLSIFRDTFKLPPGSVLTITDPRAPLPQPRRFWSAEDEHARASADRFPGTEADAVLALEGLVRDAVRLRMTHADVPVGSFLSGGIDSSLVTAVMQSLSSRPIRTYSMGFAEAAYDESDHAKQVARHLGTEHTGVIVTPDEARAVIPDLPEIFDEPFADISQIPMFLVSRLARGEISVALSGDGGDEVFGGYNRYLWGDRLSRWVRPVPHPLRRILAAGLTSVSPHGWDAVFGTLSPLLPQALRYRLPGEKLHKIGAVLEARSGSGRYLALLAAWQRPPVQGRGAPATGEFERLMDGAAPARLLERIMLTDVLTYLPDDNLAKVDRSSMAVSLEVRVPLLDHRLVQFSFRLPGEMKVRGNQTKWILRQLLHGYVPRNLVDREKMGFDVPIGAWLRGPLRPWADHYLRGSGPTALPLCRETIGRAWDEHLRGSANHGQRLWTVLMLHAWWERWMEPANGGLGAPTDRAPSMAIL